MHIRRTFTSNTAWKRRKPKATHYMPRIEDIKTHHDGLMVKKLARKAGYPWLDAQLREVLTSSIISDNLKCFCLHRKRRNPWQPVAVEYLCRRRRNRGTLGARAPQDFTINKEVPFSFLENALFFLKKIAPSNCRAPQIWDASYVPVSKTLI